MAEERVQIRVQVDGAEQAARGLQSVAQSGQQVAQRIQGAAGAVQSMTSALGSRDHTAGMIASVAGATAQFAAMGSLLGPAGTVVGGLVGLTSGLLSVARATADAGAGMASMGSHIATAEERVRRLTGALAELARNSRLDMGVASMTEYDAEIATVEARVESLSMAFERMDRSLAGSMSERALTAEIRRETDRLEELRRLRAGAGEEEASALMEELLSSGAGPDRPTRRSGGSGRNPEEEAWQARMAQMREERAAEEEAWRDTLGMIETDLEDSLAERTRLREEAAERDAEIAEREFERQAEINEALADAERQHQERIAEGRLAMKEAQEELDAQALESRRQSLGEMTGMLGDVAMQFGKTLGSIATGEKTAEEAFKGLAASFLEMISQYATLKAGTEFADAAASFARYDFGGGAAHIGAGLAFTAVAVATGVGAAAINQPPAAPARPEQAAPQDTGRGGGDVNIFWNSPVVTGATEAELGRNLRQLVAAGSA